MQDSILQSDIFTAAKGGMISFAGMLFGTSVGFLFNLVVARSLGAEAWGMYLLGISLVATLSAVASLGFKQGVRRFVPIAISQQDQSRLWGIIQVSVALPLLLSVIIAGILILTAGPLANLVFKDPLLQPVFLLFSITVPVIAVTQILISITQAFKKMQFEVYTKQITFQIAKFLLTLLLLAAGFALVGVIVSYIAASILSLALLIYYVNRLFPLQRSLHSAKRNFSEMLRFSFPAYLGQLIDTFGNSFAIFVLGFLGLTLGVGVYGAAARMSNVGSMLLFSIAAISAPIISDLYSRMDSSQLRLYYQTTTRWLVIFNLPIMLTLIFFSEPLMSIFGTEFTAGTGVLVILAIGSFINSCVGPIGTLINMTGFTKLTFVNSILILLATLIFNILLIPRLGITGAALAGLISIVLYNLIRIVEVYYLHRIFPYNWTVFKPIAAFLVTGITTYFFTKSLSFVPTAIFVISGVIVLWGVYSLVILFLGFSREDKLVLDRMRKSLKLRLSSE